MIPTLKHKLKPVFPVAAQELAVYYISLYFPKKYMFFFLLPSCSYCVEFSAAYVFTLCHFPLFLFQQLLCAFFKSMNFSRFPFKILHFWACFH